jgi:phosphoinositide-3-kinase regulatory subunit 4
VGGRSLEEYILPLMIQSLSGIIKIWKYTAIMIKILNTFIFLILLDSEEFVVEKVLNSLTSLAELGLFQKMKLCELAAVVSPLMCHPGIWIRYGKLINII